MQNLHGIEFRGVHVNSIFISRGSKLSSELFDLRAVLLQDYLLGHTLVGRGLVLNALCAIGVLQRGHAFVDGELRGRQRRDNARLCLSPEGLLQQAGQLGVAVRNVSVVIHQRCNYAAQRQQALVYVACLSGAVILRTGSTDAFRPRQVHQVELAVAHHLFANDVALLDHYLHREDAMTAAGVFVAQRCGGLAILNSALKNFKYVCDV